jgi:hypothetical protein
MTRESARAGSTRSSGSAASLGLFTFIFIILEIIAFVWCSIQQINTTHDSVFGLLQGGIIIPSHMTAAQLQLFLMGDMDKFNKIAYTIAFITQVVFLSALMPGSPIHNERLRFIVVVIFFILEVTSDLWYSAATNASLGSAFVWVFNFGNGGWLVSLMYIVAMSAGSTLLGIDAFTRLGKVFSAMSGR